MSEAERMMWVVLKCGEILDKTGKSEIAAAFKQLLEPQVIGMVVAGLIAWGASHFVGVGFIIDIAAVMFAYDEIDRLLSSVDARANISLITYDALDRPSSRSNPNAETWQFAYDLRDNRVCATKPDGHSDKLGL